jgi:prepilin-type N-terminal cleavage/methylation domain-containing protein
MSRRRAGFTLIELLTVIAILGVLAAIAIAHFWATRERAMRAGMVSDLRNLSTQQELYFDDFDSYADALGHLVNFQFSPGVAIEVTYGMPGGWAAQARHQSTSTVCGVFLGDAGAANGAPATIPGVITCS